MTRRTFRGEAIEVTFDQDLCIHATECVQGLPAVFDRDSRPWVSANNAEANGVSSTVERCPSGALQYTRLDGLPDERPSEVTTVTPIEDGPLAVRGDLLVRREDGTLERTPRAALCRCGQSKHKPLCDNSHLKTGVQAPGVSWRGSPASTATHSSVVVTDNKEASRFELRVDGLLVGHATYEDTANGRAFEHTAIAPRYQGRGLAGQLIAYSLDESRAAGRRVLPFCPFVRTFIKSHEDYLDLVDQPQHFALAPRPALGSGGDHQP